MTTSTLTKVLVGAAMGALAASIFAQTLFHLDSRAPDTDGLPLPFELEWRQNGLEKWCDRETGTLIYRNLRNYGGGIAVVPEGCSSDDIEGDISIAGAKR